MSQSIYDTLRWRLVAGRARKRDGDRCSIARLLGGECSATLHVHHLTPVEEGGAPFELDNLVTACASHHPILESFRRGLLGIRARAERTPEPYRCRHFHRTAAARRECELLNGRSRSRECQAA